MRKYAEYIGLTITLLCLVILGKNQFEKLLLVNANYGMPALIKEGKVDNLFIGSSMFRQGIDIEILNGTGKSNYILSYNGNQPLLEAWILSYLIDNGVEIENLYVDMYVYSAFEKPEFSDEKLLMEVGLKERNQLWDMYSTECGYGISDWWQFYVSGNNELLLTWPIYYNVLNAMFQDGGKLYYSSGVSDDAIGTGTLGLASDNMNDTQKESIVDIISTCNDNGINLYFIETPKYKSVMSDESYQKAINEYANLLDMYSVNYILSKDLSGDEISIYSYNFMDKIHMSTEGMKAYTNELANLIIGNLGGN
jgi:hypothetical protein